MEENISKKKLREFGLLFGFLLPIIFGWILPSLTGHSFRFWTLWISIPSLILAISKPRLLSYPYRGWMKLGYILGWLNSRLILGLIFILVLFPMAIFMKFFGYDPLRLKKQKVRSYFENKTDHMVDLRKIF